MQHALRHLFIALVPVFFFAPSVNAQNAAHFSIQHTVVADTLVLSLYIQNADSTASDFDICFADFDVRLISSAVDLTGARIASQAAPMPTPDPSRTEERTLYTGFDYFRLRHQPSVIYGNMGNETIPVLSSPTLVETVFIPITDTAGAVGIQWRNNTMYVGSCPSYSDILFNSTFEAPSGNLSLNEQDYGAREEDEEPEAEPVVCALDVSISASELIVYPLYNPASSTLTVTDTGAHGAVNYTWLDDSTAGAPRVVSPMVETDYTVIVQDSAGCLDTATVTIDADNTVCGNNKSVVCLHPVNHFNFTANICLPTYLANWLSSCLSFVSVGTCSYNGYNKTGMPGSLPNADDVSDMPVFKLFPVPTRGPVTFASHLLMSEKLSMKVTDVQGRIVYLNQLEVMPGPFQTELDFSGLSEGTYFFEFTDGIQTQSQKFTLN